MMPPKRVGSPDNFYTPEYAINPIIPYLNKSWQIWECCNGGGNMSSILEKNDLTCIKSDILTGEDFLTSNRTDFSAIVTNPPFSLKDKFLAKCFESNKPFALLLPLTALEGKFRQSLYKKYGVQVILMNKRVNYMNHEKGNGCWFASAWFTHGLNLPKDLNFVELKT